VRNDDGSTLLEVVAVLAIMAMLAGVALPALKVGATPSSLDAYAMRIASLLKADRIAAIRSGTAVATQLSAADRSVTSGRGHGFVQAPADVALDAALAERCGGAETGSEIVFFPSGLSCGGVIALTRMGQHVEIRVNWLTGGVEIVSGAKS
jgi:general secretion pathway protein H